MHCNICGKDTAKQFHKKDNLCHTCYMREYRWDKLVSYRKNFNIDNTPRNKIKIGDIFDDYVIIKLLPNNKAQLQCRKCLKIIEIDRSCLFRKKHPRLCDNLNFKNTCYKDEYTELKYGSIEVPDQYHSYLNNKFGKLTPIKFLKTENYRPIFLCQCDCGQIKEVSGHKLSNGFTKSCGCLKSSYGEYKIEQLLKENNIPYEKEKTFDTCKFSNTNRLAKFDFYIDNKYLIEFDGIQHFKITSGWNTEENFEKTQQHDEFKNQWCKENNIPLIRIPYTRENKININDLQLNTTKYRIV